MTHALELAAITITLSVLLIIVVGVLLTFLKSKTRHTYHKEYKAPSGSYYPWKNGGSATNKTKGY